MPYLRSYTLDESVMNIDSNGLRYSLRFHQAHYKNFTPLSLTLFAFWRKFHWYGQPILRSLKRG